MEGWKKERELREGIVGTTESGKRMREIERERRGWVLVTVNLHVGGGGKETNESEAGGLLGTVNLLTWSQDHSSISSPDEPYSYDRFAFLTNLITPF